MNSHHLNNPLTRLAARCATPFYGAAVSMRNWAYDSGWRPIHKAHIPVISVGNLTAGGTGKTPMAAWLVSTLIERGMKPAILMRGYKTDREGMSDEQQLLRERLPDTPVIADPDRVAAAERLREERPNVDVIVLDDGFQHRRLFRDLNLILIDATLPWGYGHLLPFGLMREPVGALRRADAVVVTRCNQISAQELTELDREIEKHHGQRPIAHTSHEWECIEDESGHAASCERSRIIVLAGIGNPQSFLDQATARFEVKGQIILPDHAEMKADLRSRLKKQAQSCGADWILTTEKDWVKLRPLLQSDPIDVPVRHTKLRLDWMDGKEELLRRIEQALKSG